LLASELELLESHIFAEFSSLLFPYLLCHMWQGKGWYREQKYDVQIRVGFFAKWLLVTGVCSQSWAYKIRRGVAKGSWVAWKCCGQSLQHFFLSKFMGGSPTSFPVVEVLYHCFLIPAGELDKTGNVTLGFHSSWSVRSSHISLSESGFT
jgi:hypothetical protein